MVTCRLYFVVVVVASIFNRLEHLRIALHYLPPSLYGVVETELRRVLRVRQIGREQ